MTKKKLLFAVGGTGGHLYPAQALAKELEVHKDHIEILFAGGKLGTSPYFHKSRFSFREIAGASVFRGDLLRSFFRIIKGVRESLRLNREFVPDLIIGFGSFYSFPLLLAARIQGIPYILVESNALPGRVNRLFSKKARFTALQFKAAALRLKGPTSLASIPHWSEQEEGLFASSEEARRFFGLDPNCVTLLIFGGSQGANAINEAVQRTELPRSIQVIHLCGANQDDSRLADRWRERGIRACVKRFEEKMHLAWRAADVAICRGGAGTCAEVIKFKTPALLIPWPGSSEGHQRENARDLAERRLAHLLEQKDLSQLGPALKQLFSERESLQKHLEETDFETIEDLGTLVARQLS